MRHALLPLLVLLLGLPARRLDAQSAESLRPGTRVRVTAPTVDSRRLTGPVLSASGDTLRIPLDGNVLPIPLGSVERLEVSDGKDRLTGALLGTVVGAAGGAAVLTLACIGSDDDCGGYTWLAAYGGAFIGAPIGAIGGYIVGRERWRTLPLSEPGSFRVAPGPRGVALAVSVAL